MKKIAYLIFVEFISIIIFSFLYDYVANRETHLEEVIVSIVIFQCFATAISMLLGFLTRKIIIQEIKDNLPTPEVIEEVYSKKERTIKIKSIDSSIGKPIGYFKDEMIFDQIKIKFENDTESLFIFQGTIDLEKSSQESIDNSFKNAESNVIIMEPGIAYQQVKN